MTLYILTHRRAVLYQPPLLIRSRLAADNAWRRLEPDADVVGDTQPDDPTGRRVVLFHADPADVAQIADDRDLIVERDIPRYPTRAPHPVAARADPCDTELGFQSTEAVPYRAYQVQLIPPTADVDVDVIVGFNETRRRYQARTNPAGVATTHIPDAGTVVTITACPYSEWWPTLVENPDQTAARIVLHRLPDVALSWWAQAVGENRYHYNAGSGIRIGVADTGCGPTPALSHVHLVGAYTGGAHDADPESTRDVEVHGTHLAGTIAGRGRPGGLASGAAVYAARVFPAAGQGCAIADVVNAVEALSDEHGVDVLLLPLGSPAQSRAERDAVFAASERGTLVVCGAGHRGEPAAYPANLDEVATVAALGHNLTVPTMSVSAAHWEDGVPGRDGWWLAGFSNLDAEPDVAAPGVGIVSTVPARDPAGRRKYTAGDGSSSAAAVAVGALAVALSRDKAYQRMARDRGRAEYARTVLAKLARPVGLPGHLGGAGIPQVRR